MNKHLTEAWPTVEEELGGGFKARASGLRGKLLLYTEAGRALGAVEDGRIEVAGMTATITPNAVIAGEETLLRAIGARQESLQLLQGERRFAAHLSPLRNTATASLDAKEVLRIAGGIAGRGYSVELKEKGTLIPALFLLERLLSLRRRAFRM